MAAHQNRSSTHPKKPLPAHARPSKPAPLSKRVNSHGTNKGGHKAAQHTEEDLEDEESMATSFLQYCTSCEKQIIVPNNSALYCSESCRKKDNEKILSYSLEHSPPPTPFSSFSFEDLPVRDIVAPRSPTAAPSQRSSCAPSEASLEGNTLSRDERLRRDSEASRYLRQFQSATAMAETSGRQTRPRYNRSSISMVTMSAAPSLSHTPASSVSMSMPYTPSNRPLPPRNNPHSSSYGSRSIDLVMPFTATTTAPPSLSQYSLKSAASSRMSIDAVEGEILYEKKSTIPTASPANGSLKQLFASTPR